MQVPRCDDRCTFQAGSCQQVLGCNPLPLVANAMYHQRSRQYFNPYYASNRSDFLFYLLSEVAPHDLFYFQQKCVSDVNSKAITASKSVY